MHENKLSQANFFSANDLRLFGFQLGATLQAMGTDRGVILKKPSQKMAQADAPAAHRTDAPGKLTEPSGADRALNRRDGKHDR